MRLSTKGRYAVMAMTDLARRQDTAARGVALADIAGRQEISLAYLEQIFARLRREGLVVSARGPGGGYRLATDAEAVTIAAIVHAVDEPLRSTRCAAERRCLVKGDKCITHDLWEGLDNQIEAYLASVSLADVARGRLAARERAA